MNFFTKQRGFDSLIGANVAINGCDELILTESSTTVIAGQLAGGSITARGSATELVISGSAILAGDISVDSLTVAGKVVVDGTVRAPTLLTIKRGGQLVAKTIQYTNIVVESEARVEGQLMPIASTQN
jgi:cytoskeletal protein CcmA (bactofilin family)